VTAGREDRRLERRATSYLRTSKSAPKIAAEAHFTVARRATKYTDVLSLFPEPLLALPDCSRITSVPMNTLSLETEFGLMRRAEMPPSPAAAHFAACLIQAARIRFPPG
jgi:hypothetical protein